MSVEVIRSGIPPSFCTASDNSLKLSFSLLRRCCRCLFTPVATMRETHFLSTWDNTVHYLLLATAVSLQTQTMHCRRSCARAETHLGWMRQSIGPAAPLPTCLSPWPHSPPLLGIRQTVCVWSCGESSPREGVRGGSGGPGCTSYAHQRRTRWSWSPSGRKGGELKKEEWRGNDKGTRKN